MRDRSNDFKETVIGVRLSDFADQSFEDFANRNELLMNTLRTVVNSTSGDHLFEDHKKVWDKTNKGLLQPCLAWNSRCPLSVQVKNRAIQSGNLDDDETNSDCIRLSKEDLIKNREKSFLNHMKESAKN